jgi:hypothetical protein
MSHLVELSSVNRVDDGSVHHHVSGSVLPHSNNFTCTHHLYTPPPLQLMPPCRRSKTKTKTKTTDPRLRAVASCLVQLGSVH